MHKIRCVNSYYSMTHLCSTRYGKIEGVKILPQRYPNIGLAAFIDFLDVKSAIEAKEAKHKIGSTELRTNFKTKTAEKFEPSARKEGGKWHDGQGEGEKHESTKSEKSRGHERYKTKLLVLFDHLFHFDFVCSFEVGHLLC